MPHTFWGILFLNQQFMRKTTTLLFFSMLMILSTIVNGQDLYDIDNIIEVKLTFKVEDWQQKLVSYKKAGKDHRVLADAEINGQQYKGVGVRLKGNSSLNSVLKAGQDKLPFNIKVDYKKGMGKPNGVLSTLKLSNVFRDPSFLREVLSYEIAGQYMPSPRANFAKLYINGEYWGLYNSTESVDEYFLANHFDNGKGALVKCDPDWTVKRPKSCPKGSKASLNYLGDNPACYEGLYELKDKSEWPNIIDVTYTLNKEVGKINQKLNVDQVLWMLAFDNVLVNLDSYIGRLCHNYYLYTDTSGYVHPILWDMNLSFGGFKFTGKGNTPLTTEEMQTLSPFLHYKENNPNFPLITQLLKDPLYKKIYIAHVKTIVEENFANGRYIEKAKEIQALIRADVEADEKKLYDMDGFDKNLMESAPISARSSMIGIVELMEKRTAYLQNHPLLQKEQPTIEKQEYIKADGFAGVQATVQGATKVWLFYRTDGTRFTKVEMFDDGGHFDEVNGDNVWGTTLDFTTAIEYYIVAENKRTAKLSPARASFEFHSSKK